MHPPGPNASATIAAAALATDEAVKLALPWLFRHVLLSAAVAANKSKRRLGARFNRPLPDALLFSTVFPRAVKLRMAMPARPLSWTVLPWMVFAVASADGVLMRMPQ